MYLFSPILGKMEFSMDYAYLFGKVPVPEREADFWIQIDEVFNHKLIQIASTDDEYAPESLKFVNHVIDLAIRTYHWLMEHEALCRENAARSFLLEKKRPNDALNALCVENQDDFPTALFPGDLDNLPMLPETGKTHEVELIQPTFDRDEVKALMPRLSLAEIRFYYDGKSCVIYERDNNVNDYTSVLYDEMFDFSIE